MQKFEADEATELSVFGFIDNAHAATAEFFNDAIVGYSLANHFGGMRAVMLRGHSGVRQRGFEFASLDLGGSQRFQGTYGRKVSYPNVAKTLWAIRHVRPRGER